MPSFTYTILRTRKLLSGIRLSIHPEKGVIVKAPFWLPEIAIRQFVEEKKDWIEGHLRRIKKPEVLIKQYQEGEKHLYFGAEYALVILETNIPLRTEAKINGEDLHISIFDGHTGEKRSAEIREAILRLYLETGIGVITEKVNYYANRLGVDYTRIDIKKVSSIWGSCSATNRLCFNRKLIMAPHEVVNYVIIHEVCHMRERNHSSHFWALVAQFDPLYRDHRRWLHRNHLLLSI